MRSIGSPREGAVAYAQSVIAQCYIARGVGVAVGVAAVRDSAQERFRPRYELGGGEGLGNIVVRAAAQTRYLVPFLGAGGEHYDADGPAPFADAAADLKPVDAGHHDVEYHDVEGASGGVPRGESFFTVADGGHLPAFTLKVDDDEVPDGPFVLGEKYPFQYSQLLTLMSLPY